MLLVASALCHAFTEAYAAPSKAALSLSLSLRSGGVHSRASVMFRRLLFVISFGLCSEWRFVFLIVLLGLRVLRSQQHKYTMVAGPVDYK